MRLTGKSALDELHMYRGIEGDRLTSVGSIEFTDGGWLQSKGGAGQASIESSSTTSMSAEALSSSLSSFLDCLESTNPVTKERRNTILTDRTTRGIHQPVPFSRIVRLLFARRFQSCGELFNSTRVRSTQVALKLSDFAGRLVPGLNRSPHRTMRGSVEINPKLFAILEHHVEPGTFALMGTHDHACGGKLTNRSDRQSEQITNKQGVTDSQNI